MIYFLALIPATALTVAGYFVLFLSNRSEGALRAFGKYLGFWAFTLAGLLILGAIFAAAHRGGRWPMMHDAGPYGGRFSGPCAGEPERPSQPDETPPVATPPSPPSPSP